MQWTENEGSDPDVENVDYETRKEGLLQVQVDENVFVTEDKLSDFYP